MIAPGIRIVEPYPALYLEEEDAVVIADIHLGYEEAMARQGVYLPRLQYDKISIIIKKLLETTQASKLVIAGDIKHEFSRLLKQEKLEVAKLLHDAYRAGYKEVIVVRGNHDNFIGPLIENLGGKFVEDLDTSTALITHGHKDVKCNDKPIIMGHEHPALQVSIGGAKTKFPVFLIVPLEECGTAIVLPASGAYQVGNNITLEQENYLSPIIRKRAVLEEAKPIIIDEDEGLMPLPPLGDLRTVLAI